MEAIHVQPDTSKMFQVSVISGVATNKDGGKVKFGRRAAEMSMKDLEKQS